MNELEGTNRTLKTGGCAPGHHGHARARNGLRRGLRAALLASLLLLVLPSCFTMTLWGFEPEYSTDVFTGRTEGEMQYDSDTEWSWNLFGLRLLGTPFAVLLDCVTAPVQTFLFWGDDDC